MPGLVPGIHVLLEVDKQTWMAGHRQAEATPLFERLCPAMTPVVQPHHPNQSALRGSSTVFTFSSLIVPFAITSLMSPSVAPEILAR